MEMRTGICDDEKIGGCSDRVITDSMSNLPDGSYGNVNENHCGW